jgi:uncharacterized protein (DUF58 family)
MSLTVTELLSIRQRMGAVAELVQLPLRSALWQGMTGGMSGYGTGNSQDFQDQRAYTPGDDPRHINWQAYGRTGSYTMKLYKQEVSPRVDLLLDVSPSMFLNVQKTQRVWELAYFTLESALHLGAALRVHVLGKTSRELPLERALAGEWELPETTATPEGPRLEAVPLRQGSLRVLISDLLFPAAPERVTTPLMANRGRAVLLAAFCQEEAAPDWQGNLEFHDSETGTTEKRRVTAEIKQRYLQAYKRHFLLWREPCAKLGIPLARVQSEGDLLPALRAEAANVGAVVMS